MTHCVNDQVNTRLMRMTSMHKLCLGLCGGGGLFPTCLVMSVIETCLVQDSRM